MKSIRLGTAAVICICALVVLCTPVVAAGTTSLLPQMNSYSRLDSFLSGYTPGTGSPAPIPVIPTPSPQPSVNPSGNSASDRIASLLSSDIANWRPPEGREYNTESPVLPHHSFSGGSGFNWDDIFYDPPACMCC
ncbi:MAG TPA: hypothetical protein VMW63_11275 [Methanoregulaceae archaeon]|nr:hypothetical protein [Methanoregulaceae archaeon]